VSVTHCSDSISNVSNVSNWGFLEMMEANFQRFQHFQSPLRGDGIWKLEGRSLEVAENPAVRVGV
jgi:hypothetical protein